jgi:hypothetical protein
VVLDDSWLLAAVVFLTGKIVGSVQVCREQRSISTHLLLLTAIMRGCFVNRIELARMARG